LDHAEAKYLAHAKAARKDDKPRLLTLDSDILRLCHDGIYRNALDDNIGDFKIPADSKVVGFERYPNLYRVSLVRPAWASDYKSIHYDQEVPAELHRVARQWHTTDSMLAYMKELTNKHWSKESLRQEIDYQLIRNQVDLKSPFTIHVVVREKAWLSLPFYAILKLVGYPL